MDPVRTERQDVRDVWDAADREFRDVWNELISRSKLSEVTFPSGSLTQVVQHGLQREPQAVLPCVPTAAGTLHWTSKDKFTITIVASAAMTVHLLIF
jgi:hypothetical protein